MMVSLVVAGPERRIGRHRDQQESAGPADAPELGQRQLVVRRVLDDIQTGDEVKMVRLPRQLLEAADDDLAQAAPAGELGRVGTELDARHLSGIRELLEG